MKILLSPATAVFEQKKSKWWKVDLPPLAKKSLKNQFTFSTFSLPSRAPLWRNINYYFMKFNDLIFYLLHLFLFSMPLQIHSCSHNLSTTTTQKSYTKLLVLEAAKSLSNNCINHWAKKIPSKYKHKKLPSMKKSMVYKAQIKGSRYNNY